MASYTFYPPDLAAGTALGTNARSYSWFLSYSDEELNSTAVLDSIVVDFHMTADKWPGSSSIDNYGWAGTLTSSQLFSGMDDSTIHFNSGYTASQKHQYLSSLVDIDDLTNSDKNEIRTLCQNAREYPTSAFFYGSLKAWTTYNATSLVQDISITFNFTNTTSPTAPTSISLASSNVAPYDTLTVNWSGASHGIGNNVKEYVLEIYDDSLELAKEVKINKNTLYGSYEFSLNGELEKGTYTTMMWVKGELDEGYPSNRRGPSFTVNVSGPDPVNNFKINGSSSTIYIGKTNTPAILASWEAPTNSGINNTIKNYAIRSTDNAINMTANSAGSHTVVSQGSELSKKVKTFQIIANASKPDIGENGSQKALSSTSSSISVKELAAISKPSLKTSLPEITSSNIALRWNSIALPTGASAVKYIIQHSIKKSTENNYGNYTTIQAANGITATGIDYYITNISPGDSVKFKIIARAYANSDSYNESYLETSGVMRATVLQMDTNSLIIKNERGNSANSGYAYTSVSLQWGQASSGNSNSNIVYQIRYKDSSNGNWSDLLAQPTTSLNYTYSNFKNKVAEGNKIYFKVVATDNYGGMAETAEVYVTRIAKPVISNVTLGNINYNTVPYSFKYSFGIPEENLKCEVSLGYANIWQTYITEEYTTQNDVKTGEINFDLSDRTTNLIENLYNKVITNRYVKPDGQLKIKLSSVSLPECYAENIIDFKYNFLTVFNPPNIRIFSEPEKNYYNPDDSFKIEFGSPQGTDAAGGTTGVKFEYIIVGNNKKWTEQSPNNDKEDKISDTAPIAKTDIDLSYTLTTKVIYTDYSYELTSVSNIIHIARWYDDDNINLSAVTRTNNIIKGILMLPKNLCSSTMWNNLQEASYSLYYADDDEIILEDQEIDLKTINLEKDCLFSFPTDKEGSIELYAKVKFTNTSGNILTEISPMYLLRSGGVPLAIRKGRVGINVESSDFIVDEENVSNNSALHVNSANDSAPVATFSANTGGDKTLMSLLLGSSEVGAIKTRNQNALIIERLTTQDNIILNSSEWTSSNGYFKYTINNDNITAETFQEVLPSNSITLEQLKVYQKANLIGGEQGEGYCEIICFGTKPTENIPIILLVRGG